MQNETLFRDKPVWNAILTMAVPSVFSILIMILYNMADMFFVGQLGGADSAPVAAVAVVGPVFSVITAIATMIGVGGCATIAKAAGAGDTNYAKTCASLCGWAAILFGSLCGVLILLFTDPLLHFLGVLSEVVPDARAYMRTLAIGAPLMLFATGFGTLLRSEGAVKDGFIGNLVGTAVNLILDPLFIMMLKLGVAGAAAATVIGNLVAAAYYLRFVFCKASLLNLVPSNALRYPQALLNILALGFPNAMSSILSGSASIFSNHLLLNYGYNAQAAMGAAGKVTMSVSLIQMGICMGVQPLMAYNYGAHNIPRLKEVLQKLAVLTAGFGVATTVLCSLARNTLIGLFLQNPEALALGKQMVVWLLLAGPVLGVYYLSCNFLQASGNALSATIISVLRQGVLLIPSLHLMHNLLGFAGIAIAHTVADIAAALVALAVCLWEYHKHMRSDFSVEDTI
ncbi:MAG: MATE family efflux transporter [Oscillospiraceae bacterium]|nr:MATE family efflux transporter [Oscillospiraceae bacterium]